MTAQRLLRVGWLTGIWLALWSDLSVANLVSGVLVAAAIVACFDTWRTGRVIIRPVAAVRFVAYFLFLLVGSSVSVARAVMAPRHRVRTGIVAIPLRGCSDAVATLIADAISLTPGTLTLEMHRDSCTLYVHALDTRDLDELQQQVRHLEVLAVTAFGDADALAGLTVDDTTTWRGR